ncbi:MAG TPA: CpsD/CapB family tyrosine-protein kinase [Steroidobacteraceae bacterium]|jgi:protein-tyrosine kinase|nr:CpsD/CapB family tyrosine-protein kinase [Steroidobacteraceae bacterium]
MVDPIILRHDRTRASAGEVELRQPEHTDTLTGLTRIVEVDPTVIERERILPPGAGGVNGGPYKLLRTQVLRRLTDLGANSLAVVGAAAGSGKTLTAINLAIAIAAEHDRTALLVDFDLRKPSIHNRFGIECRVGIDDCLRRGQPLQDAMVRLAGYERLVLLPARERCQDSSELLSSNRTQHCIQELRQRYKDRVLVFDLPPVLQADDALAFSRHVQSALVVVSEGRTQRQELVRTLDLLRDLPIIGTVLNGTREAVTGYY